MTREVSFMAPAVDFWEEGLLLIFFGPEFDFVGILMHLGDSKECFE